MNNETVYKTAAVFVWNLLGATSTALISGVVYGGSRFVSCIDRILALLRVIYDWWFDTHLPEQRYEFSSMMDFLFEYMN